MKNHVIRIETQRTFQLVYIWGRHYLKIKVDTVIVRGHIRIFNLIVVILLELEKKTTLLIILAIGEGTDIT